MKVLILGYGFVGKAKNKLDFYPKISIKDGLVKNEEIN